MMQKKKPTQRNKQQRRCRRKKPNNSRSRKHLGAKGQPSNNEAKKKKPNEQQCDNADGGMDDIVAQLNRQRQKSRATGANNPKSNNEEPSPDDPKAARPKPEHLVHRAVVGKFQYDPALKRYFPKSTFESNEDVCVQRIQKQIASKELRGDGRRRWRRSRGAISMHERPFHSKENVTDDDLGKVVFRGTRLPANGRFDRDSSTQAKRQSNNIHCPMQKSDHDFHSCPSIPCSARTAFLLSTSLEYCAAPRRRNAIASVLGPLSVARTAKVVPTQSTLETLKHEAKKHVHSRIDEPFRPHVRLVQRQPPGMKNSTGDSSSHMQTWASMLHPLKTSRESPMYVKRLFLTLHQSFQQRHCN